VSLLGRAFAGGREVVRPVPVVDYRRRIGCQVDTAVSPWRVDGRCGQVGEFGDPSAHVDAVRVVALRLAYRIEDSVRPGAGPALSRLLDTVLDRAVPAGYSRAGFALRRRGWPADDPRPDALRGKTVLVTGANSGIGKAITEASAALGASVLMTVRDRIRGEEACAQIRAAVPNADVQVLVCDVANLAAVRAFAADVTDRRDRWTSSSSVANALVR
jgi:short chain dehydrogenase